MLMSIYQNIKGFFQKIIQKVIILIRIVTLETVFCRGKCTSSVRLNGKTAIITGSNCGIGKATVQDFFQRGARVIMACRNIKKANAAAADIKTACKNKKGLGEIVIVKLDLADLKSVHDCAKNLLKNEKRFDILINNAGVMFCPESRTKDGFEMQFGTNHLGHFLFTLLLLPKIIKNAPARIVNVSSLAHCLSFGPMRFDDLNWEKRSYSATEAYFQSKLANILFTRELARRLKGANIEDVTTYSLHPGVVATELTRHISSTFFRGSSWLYKKIGHHFIKTPKQGAQTTIYCAIDEKCSKETGLYYSDCEVTACSANSRKIDNAKKLWDVSIKLVGLDENYDPFSKREL